MHRINKQVDAMDIEINEANSETTKTRQVPTTCTDTIPAIPRLILIATGDIFGSVQQPPALVAALMRISMSVGLLFEVWHSM